MGCYYLRTHHNVVPIIHTYSVNDWEGEFALCEVFCEALIITVLENTLSPFFWQESSNYEWTIM